MIRIMVSVVLALTSLLSASASASAEHSFWQWFQIHQDSLYEFERDQDRIFDTLSAQLHKVDSALTFEFGPKRNGKREFIISADGIRAAFPKVEALYAAAPSLPKWIIVKFRPRRAPFDIRFGDEIVKADDVSVTVHPQGDQVGLTVTIPGYDPAEHDRFAGFVYLFLDQALGEFDVETRVGTIDIQKPSNPAAAALSLRALPAAVDAYFAHQAR